FLSLGFNPRIDAAALGDVNGDGKLDLVTLQEAEGGQEVAVRFGNGKGNFGERASFAMGSSPVGLVVADFNGDGRADVATSDDTDSAVSVRLANPDGTLGPVTTYDVGGPQGALATADVNGDGISDLVTVNKAGTSLTVLLGHSNGTFTVMPPITVPSVKGTSIAFGDLNEDGHLDIAVTGAVLLGNGDGSFTVVARPEIAGNPVVADVDGNKHLDVLFPSTTGTQTTTAAMVILRGNGDGTFGPPVNV